MSSRSFLAVRLVFASLNCVLNSSSSKSAKGFFSAKWFDFYPRDAMLARVIEIATCPSVCPSVCLSVTRRYCVKMKKASGMISSPSGSPKTVVF